MKCRFVSRSVLICLLIGLVSCDRTVDPDFDVFYTCAINNVSNHSLSISYYDFAGVDKETRRPVKTKEVFSLEVPPRKTLYKSVYAGVDAPILHFYSCTIVFDDGRKLEYSKTSVDDNIISSINPLSVKAYDCSAVDGVSIYTFTITNEHYSAAE